MNAAAAPEESLNDSDDLFDDDDDGWLCAATSSAQNTTTSEEGSLSNTDNVVSKNNLFTSSSMTSTLRQNMLDFSNSDAELEYLDSSNNDKRAAHSSCEDTVTDDSHEEEHSSSKRHKVETSDGQRGKLAKSLSHDDYMNGSEKTEHCGNQQGESASYTSLRKPQTSSTSPTQCSSSPSSSLLPKQSLTQLDSVGGPSAQENMSVCVTTDYDLPAVHASADAVPGYTCPFCGAHETRLSDLEVHIASSHPDLGDPAGCGAQRWVCPLCDLDLVTEPGLTVHLSSVHSEAEGGSSCPLCGLSCVSDRELQTHVQTHAEDDTHYSVAVASPNGASSLLTCPLCGLSLGDPDLLQSHVESYHLDVAGVGGAPSNVALTCPVCDLAVDDPDLLTSHVESHFSAQHMIPCDAPLASGKDRGETSKATKKKSPSINKENIPVGAKTSNSAGSLVRNKASTSSFRSPPNASSSASLSGKDTHSYRRQFEQSLERAVMRGEMSVADFHEQRASMAGNDLRGVDDGSSRVDGLIEQLARLYRQQARPGQAAHLCSPASHFSGSHGDRGWGCGYRNFQMLLSCLAAEPEYASRLFPGENPAIPSIPKVQQMIEWAWRSGFDQDGCRQLKGKLVGTQKWIGATEIVATLSSLGVRCRLADFHVPSSSDGTHPCLIEWVTNYFTNRRHQFTPPLYLQHQGHSRTIVGVEIDRDTTRLLLFDPGSRSEHLAGLTSGGGLVWKSLRTFRRTVAAFKAKQYQIVAVDGILTLAEREECKIIRSERIF